MADHRPPPRGEQTPESCLLRLFRCMKTGEKEDLLLSALQILAARCSFFPHYAHLQADALREELEDEDLNSRLRSAWPADWAGRQIVELDNVGDPGAWLEQVIGSPLSELLFGWTWDVDDQAACMAEDYLTTIREQGYPLPSDFGEDATDGEWTPEEEKQGTAEFVSFFHEWRERVLDTIEKQNQPSGDERIADAGPADGTGGREGRVSGEANSIAPNVLRRDPMNDPSSIATWDALLELGFAPDPGVRSDPMPGLSFDFGNVKLSAGRLINLKIQEVVLFHGILTTARTAANVEFEMPGRVASRGQCAAWIVWHLDQAASGRVFQSGHQVGWVNQGRQDKYLLPWVADLDRFRARPRCMVEREWLRLAFRSLREILSTADPEAVVVFDFDGSQLNVRCAGRVVPMVAEGAPWPSGYSLPAAKLRNLPTRLMSDRLEVAVSEGRLHIGNRVYDGVVDAGHEVGGEDLE